MLQTNWRKLHVRAKINIFNEYFRAKNRAFNKIIKLSQAEILWLSRHTKNSMLGFETRQTMEISGDKPESSVCLYMKRWGRKSKERFITNWKIGKWILWASKTSVNFLVFSQLRKSYYIVVVLRDFPKITNGPYMKMSKTSIKGQ